MLNIIKSYIDTVNNYNMQVKYKNKCEWIYKFEIKSLVLKFEMVVLAMLAALPTLQNNSCTECHRISNDRR